MASPKAHSYFGVRPSPISRRQRAISTTTSSSDEPMAVHSRLRSPTFGRSLGSKAYWTHSRRSLWSWRPEAGWGI